MNTQEARERLLEAIRQSDRTEANVILDAWAGDVGYEETIREVLEPVMEQIGEMWVEEGQLTFAQEPACDRLLAGNAHHGTRCYLKFMNTSRSVSNFGCSSVLNSATTSPLSNCEAAPIITNSP